MSRSFGIKELMDHNFKSQSLSPKWRSHLGNLQKNSSIMIIGPAKNGKTDYAMKLTKELANNGLSVFYNSFEEGKSATLQESAKRNNMQEVAGKVQFGNKMPYEQMMKRMKGTGSSNVLLIDSWDYMKLTAELYKTMRVELKRKMIIIISWADGKRPDDSEAKKIEHMCDAIITVREYKAKSVSRLGGNEVMHFKEKESNGHQASLFNL